MLALTRFPTAPAAMAMPSSPLSSAVFLRIVLPSDPDESAIPLRLFPSEPLLPIWFFRITFASDPNRAIPYPDPTEDSLASTRIPEESLKVIPPKNTSISMSLELTRFPVILVHLGNVLRHQDMRRVEDDDAGEVVPAVVVCDLVAR